MSDKRLDPSTNTTSDSAAEPSATRPSCVWAMLAYIAGDNRLSAEGLRDIEEMCSIGASENVYVAVEIDTFGDWNGSIRYEITKPQWNGRSYRMVVERLPERDSSNAEIFLNFARWVGTDYPAKHRLLAVWGHGEGFKGRGRAAAQDRSGSSLTIPQLARALRRAEPQLGRVSILGFDACSIAILEVAHELCDVADYLVGSQAVVPGNGWSYDSVLHQMRLEPDPKQLAEGIVKLFVDMYRTGPEPATQSAIDLQKIPAASDALQGLGETLARGLPNHRSEIFLARDRTQTYEDFWDHIDIIDFCDSLVVTFEEPAIREAVARLRESVRASVIHADGHHPLVARSNGLSMWFPRDPWQYFSHRGDYLQLRGCSAGTGWVRFLDALHA